MIQLSLDDQLKVAQAQLKEFQEHEIYMFKKTLSPKAEIRQKQVGDFQRHLIEVSTPFQNQIMNIMAIMPLTITIPADLVARNFINES